GAGASTAGKTAPSTVVIPTLAISRATLTSHTPPTAASASTAGCCHWEAPYSAQGPPSPWYDRIQSGNSQQLGTTISPNKKRGHDTGGRSRRRTATANGDHIQPMTAP